MDDNTYKGQFVSRDIDYPAPKTREIPVFTRAVRGRARPAGVKKKGAGFSRTRLSLGICAAVLLVCSLFSLIDTPFTNGAVSMIRNAVSYDLDLEDTIGRLKFVEEVFPGVTSVFSSVGSMRYPVEGTVTEKFDGSANLGIKIQAESGANVYAALEGTVEKRGVSDEMGNYLRIQHSDSLETYYYGLDYSALAEGTAVTKGQEIGTLGSQGVLYFEVHLRGAPRDPLSYLGS